MLALEPPRRYMPRSVSAFALPRSTQLEQQSDMQMVATFAGLRSAQERPSFEVRLVTTSAGPGGT